jgi:hypothetical protein
MANRILAGSAALTMALSLALPASSMAQETPTLTLDGTYLFETDAQQDGRPVCSETWSFGADGAMTVQSGEERVRKRYRTETDRDGTWIVAETLETNGAPDCMGQRTPDVTPGERRTYVVPMNGGIILTCPAPQRMADGAPYITACYGSIVPVRQAG